MTVSQLNALSIILQNLNDDWWDHRIEFPETELRKAQATIKEVMEKDDGFSAWHIINAWHKCSEFTSNGMNIQIFSENLAKGLDYFINCNQ